jgi:CMP-N-acetylneuraminic acid synthetase
MDTELKKNHSGTILAIIPARGGSRGLPRKNIKLLAGKPLIAYAVEVGLQSPSVDRLIVSTEDDEIAALARNLGADVPFLRPMSLAEDNVPDQPVFRHVIQCLEEKEHYYSDFVLNLRPTTPFKTVGDVESVVSKWRKTGCDCVRTVTKVEGKCHPYWTLKLKGDVAEPFLEDIDLNRYHQRQLLPEAYYINGVVDGFTPDRALRDCPLYGGNMRTVCVAPERALDIDTDLDFSFCEHLLKKRL